MKQTPVDVDGYPPAPTLQEGWLDVGHGHSLYYAESGAKMGIPVVNLHGGPGSFSKEKHRILFNPEKYRIITFDQRGCGRSKAKDPLKNNTTQDLVDDIERLRKHLGIGKWLVTGGSWGSTLALLYTQRYPQNVLGVAVWAVFLADIFNHKWLFEKGGAARFFPQEYANFIASIDEKNPNYILPTCERLLNEGELDDQYATAKALMAWEAKGMTLAYQPEEELPEETEELKQGMVNAARIWVAYANRKFDIREEQILNDVFQLSGIPGFMAHGRYDMCCPPRNAWQLHRRWADSKLELVTEAAHSKDDMLPQLIKALDTFAESQHF